jgi:hypothetical protein
MIIRLRGFYVKLYRFEVFFSDCIYDYFTFLLIIVHCLLLIEKTYFCEHANSENRNNSRRQSAAR